MFRWNPYSMCETKTHLEHDSVSGTDSAPVRQNEQLASSVDTTKQTSSQRTVLHTVQSTVIRANLTRDEHRHETSSAGSISPETSFSSSDVDTPRNIDVKPKQPIVEPVPSARRTLNSVLSLKIWTVPNNQYGSFIPTSLAPFAKLAPPAPPTWCS